MLIDNKIWVAYNGEKIVMEPSMANRHGLIAGATGTGKTVTLKVLAESFSDLGVPVFLADVKGDISGMCQPGVDSEGMQKRIKRFCIEDFSYKSYPTRFWDIFGEEGSPVRTTISEMGPLLLSRLLELSDAQSGVLNIVFRIADDEGMLLLDMKDLRSMVSYVGEHAKEYTLTYGNVSAQSVGAIQRKLLSLEDQGAEKFFGETALDISDWIQTENGRGVINILNCVKLIQNPTLYSTFMLWLLSELFEQLPEAGDLDKPKMVFFFDEAHMLFDSAPKALLQKVEQVVKLIRSKGVGVYFVTQNPADIPDGVLAQLGNRIQHALRAYTPAEQKAVKTAASSFRPNPAFKTEDVITSLGTGEALISLLDSDGRPQIVQQAFVLPPQSLMGRAADDYISSALGCNPYLLKYEKEIDRESAYELLAKKAEQQQKDDEKAAKEDAKEKEKEQKKKSAAKKSTKKSVGSKVVDKAASSFGSAIGRGLCRGLLGILKNG